MILNIKPLVCAMGVQPDRKPRRQVFSHAYFQLFDPQLMGCGMYGLSGQAVVIHVGMAVAIGPGLVMGRSMGDWSVQGARTMWKPAMRFHVQVNKQSSTQTYDTD